jgi:hypothetical protein
VLTSRRLRITEVSDLITMCRARFGPFARTRLGG